MNILLLPNDILFYITSFLSVSDKIAARETCMDLYNSINYMQIRVEKMDIKIDKLLNGNIYILNRLRLAALCGLQNHSVAEIWSWISLISDIKQDSLQIIRRLDNAIK